jgi:hypothetical protein
MNVMELTIKQESFIRTLFKWTLMSVFLTVCAFSINSVHQNQLKKLVSTSDLLKQKSILVSQMHNDMLLISRIQLQILHASSESEVRDKLRRLSNIVTNHLVNYHELKTISSDKDAEILAQFKTSFQKWHEFNKSILGYANIVSDTNFINTLNMIDLAFNQLDSDASEKYVFLSQLNSSFKIQNRNSISESLE